MNNIIEFVLLVVGIISLILIITLFLFARVASQGAVKQSLTRLEAPQPHNTYHLDALAAEYKGVSILFCIREGDVNELTQIVDTSIYNEKNLIGLTLISPKNINEDKEEIKSLVLNELPKEIQEIVPDEMLDQMIEQFFHSENYCMIDNADLVCTKNGQWLIKINGTMLDFL